MDGQIAGALIQAVSPVLIACLTPLVRDRIFKRRRDVRQISRQGAGRPTRRAPREARQSRGLAAAPKTERAPLG